MTIKEQPDFMSFFKEYAFFFSMEVYLLFYLDFGSGGR